MRILACSVVAVLVFALPARAETADPSPISFTFHSLHASELTTQACGDEPASMAAPNLFALVDVKPQAQDAGQPVHAAAVEHSAAYQTRAKIHKIASYATLPLFATEVVLGQRLYNSTSLTTGLRSAHIAVGTAIMGLFAVNTVTGAMNLFGEDRQESNGRALRLVHGLLMMAADVGFVATTATGPHRHHQGTLTFATDPTLHRNLALTSIGVGTAGYLVMFIGSHL
jgi:hypothetical protein